MFHIPQAYHGVKEGRTYIPPTASLPQTSLFSLSIYFLIRLKVLQMHTRSQASSRGYYLFFFFTFDFAYSHLEQEQNTFTFKVIPNLFSISE